MFSSIQLKCTHNGIFWSSDLASVLYMIPQTMYDFEYICSTLRSRINVRPLSLSYYLNIRGCLWLTLAFVISKPCVRRTGRCATARHFPPRPASGARWDFVVFFISLVLRMLHQVS